MTSSHSLLSLTLCSAAGAAAGVALCSAGKHAFSYCKTGKIKEWKRWVPELKDPETIVKYTWTIHNSNLDCKKLYSETFFTDKHTPWRILIYPKGDKDIDGFSIYLDVGDTADFPVGWTRSVNSIKFSLINQVNDKNTKTKGSRNEVNFNAKRPSHGYRVINPIEFDDPLKGFLVNDKCMIVLEFSMANLGHKNAYDNNTSILQMSSFTFGNALTDFKGVCKIEKRFVPFVEDACSKHPTLIESQLKKKRSQLFTEWSFTALGRVLHFLKTKRLEEMIRDDASKELEKMWEELESFGFDDLSWLESHVESALHVKRCFERALLARKLRGDDAVDAEGWIKSQKSKMINDAAEAKGEQDFTKGKLDDKLGEYPEMF